MSDFLPFFLLHITPIIIFYSTHSAMSMAHANVLRESWKRFEITKVWNNCLACHRGCAWFKYFVWWRWSIARLYDFVGIAFFGHVILRRHNCLVSMLEVLLFLCQFELLSWIFRIWIFMPQLWRITLKLCQVAFHIKNSVFIIYLLEDEQELSLGMLIRLQRIYNFWLLYAILSTVLDVYGLYYTLSYHFLGLTY